jgi:REP element-mobilizing transposase RayT
MVLGSHIVFSTYGFWLPNDPRGSWSDFVGSWELFRFGPATKTTERRSLAYDTHDRAKRLAAKGALKRLPVVFDGLQARAVGRGFQAYVEAAELTVWACSILPDHVHMVLARHEYNVEKLVIQLKGRATEQLLNEKRHPFQPAEPYEKVTKCWGRGLWKVFLDTGEAIRRAIEYVEQNPVKEGKPLQKWPFVEPFDA